MKKSEIVAVVPALGSLLLPSLSCPACWPGYASLLGAAGLSFLGESKYLIWLSVAALVISLIMLFRRSRQGSYVPVLIGAFAALLILTGKLLLNSNPMVWLGVAALLGAFIWSPKAKPAGLPRLRGRYIFGGGESWH